MAIEILLVFAVILFALFLFVTEKLPVDITAFLILITLMLLGLLYPDSFPTVSEGLSGLSNEATITVLAMFILSAGVQRTGVINRLGRKMFGFVGNSEIKQLLAIALIVAPISGFVNNTAAVAILLPMVLDLARRSGTAATKLLIPLSFFGMLGGMLTLIGTSTNILASSILRDASKGQAIGLFEFTHVGAIVLLVGVVYFVFIGRFLLPERKSDGKGEKHEDLFLTEVVIEKGSNFIGKTLEKSKFADKYDVLVMKLIRDNASFIKSAEEKSIEEGDILVLRATEQRIIELTKQEHIKLLPNFDEEARKRPAGTGKIIKVMLRGFTAFHDRSLDEINFWRRFNASVVGLNVPQLKGQRLGAMPLNVGQILMVQASVNSLRRLRESRDFVLLETLEDEFNPEKMWLSLTIVAGVIFCSAVMGIPIVISALVGVVAMILTRCLNTEEMYNAINWEIIFLLAGVIPLGIAMQKSGAADMIATTIGVVSDGQKAIFILILLYVVTTVLTEVISNNAAVVLLAPIAISVADAMNVNPLPLILVVMFAASTSFLTPVGYQTNTMVYGSGNYRFFDFMKVGAPLNLILLFITTYLINCFWPLLGVAS